MGQDKASMIFEGERLAARVGRVLAAVATPALEVGGGWSGLAQAERDPRQGPLPAIAAGWQSLNSLGHFGDVLVVATDLPWISIDTLRWLSGRPGSASVVPAVGGRAQPLCARWSSPDLDRAVLLVENGERRASAVFGTDTEFPDESVWGSSLPAEVFQDVDRPEDIPGHKP